MHFYTSFFSSGSKLYVRSYLNGIQSKDIIDIKPSLYIKSNSPDANESHTNIFGDRISKIDFDTPKEAKEFIASYKGSNVDVYGYPRFDYMEIDKMFPGEEVKFDMNLIRIMSFDIETEVESGWPNIFTANERINLISISYNKKIVTFGLKPWANSESDVTYVYCDSEEKLLLNFLSAYREINPDILTGWNINFFDIPYLYNRISVLFGEDKAKKLSPFGRCHKKVTAFKGKEEIMVDIQGVQVLDYLELYKKFELSPRDNYKLDTIAYVELGDRKVDYDGSFKEFYTNDWDTFVSYNAHDVRLIDRLDEKLKFIQVACGMAYSAKCNFTDVYRVTRIWDNIIALYLNSKNVHVASDFAHSGDPYQGAFVKPTVPGKYDWIASFDVASLYPSLIIQYNISPDTILPRRLFPNITAQDVIERNDKYKLALEIAKDNNATLCANGALFSKDKQGFLPYLTEKYFNKRVSEKKEMKKWSVELEKVKQEMIKRGIKV